MKVKDLYLPILLAGAVLFAYHRTNPSKPISVDEPAAPSAAHRVTPATEDRSWATQAATNAPSGQFHCDGRTQCAQMTSCAEATYFLQNCPNTQMDGNNDGEPCEQQWCN